MARRSINQTMREENQATHSSKDPNSQPFYGGSSPGSSIIDIDSKGELLLQVSHHDDSIRFYRASKAVLRRASAYFNVLLDPDKFSEGAAVRAKLAKLSNTYAEIESIPSSDLPCVAISDIGPVPKAKVSEDAFKLFLDILHRPKASLPAPQIRLISILAVISDRFDSTTPISSYVLENEWKCKPARQAKHIKSRSQFTEFRRQKLLIGLIFGFEDWVYEYSCWLIYQGLEKEIPHSASVNEVPWWNLPNGVEGRWSNGFGIPFKKHPQCKLGYDSSWQCDSFQLGEMIRYFVRKGTLCMQNTFAFHDRPQFAGSAEDFVFILRQCTSYQIDRNHTHCGARNRLEPALRSIVFELSNCGICLYCWKRNRSDESWLENPTGGKWYVGKPKLDTISSGCPAHRTTVTTKAICTADERDWTPPEG